jgi:nitrogen fixation protein FixH
VPEQLWEKPMSAENLHASRTGSSKGRAPGWWYPWIFVGFFFITVAVNGTMVFYALNSWTGLETQHYWERGTAYNAAIEGARDQRKRGWQVGIEFQAADLTSARLAVSLKDHSGNILDGARVTAEVVRPTSEGHDFTVELPDQGQGRYTAEFALPLPGQWDIRVIADHAQGDYQEVRRVIVK